MKKYLIFLFILSLAVSFAAAQEAATEEEAGEGLGLTVGLEFGFGDISIVAEYPYIMPFITYETSLLDGALDLYAELDYTILYNKEEHEGKNFQPQSLYFDLMAAYNLSLSDASTLSIILENEFYDFRISPLYKNKNRLTGILTPAVNFNQEFGFGDLYAKIGLPIYYIKYDRKADTEVDLFFTLGWASTFGLGLETTWNTHLAPDKDNDIIDSDSAPCADDAGFSSFELILSYEKGPMYFETSFEFFDNIKANGVTITPEFRYTYMNLTFYANCEFAGIGVDVDSPHTSVTPAVGIKYSF